MPTSIQNNVIKLTSVQKKVMSYLGHGWATEPGAGMSIKINGVRICNCDTLYVLERHRLVEQLKTNSGIKLVGEWVATEAGKSFQKELEGK